MTQSNISLAVAGTHALRGIAVGILLAIVQQAAAEEIRLAQDLPKVRDRVRAYDAFKRAKDLSKEAGRKVPIANTPETILARGVYLREVIQEYQKAIEAFPLYVEAHFEIGICHELIGTDESRKESVRYFRKTIELDPARVEAYAHLAIVLLDLGEVDAAKAVPESLLGISKEHAEKCRDLVQEEIEYRRTRRSQ